MTRTLKTNGWMAAESQDFEPEKIFMTIDIGSKCYLDANLYAAREYV